VHHIFVGLARIVETPESERATKVVRASGRERAVRAAYELFSRDGTRAVGIEAVIARANIAKMTLYRNFPSKDGLILAFLDRREQLWTQDWLLTESSRMADTPQGRLLAIFDLFGAWFRGPDFEGCAFVRVLMEVTDPASDVHQAGVRSLANIRVYLADLAAAAGIADPESFARQWHILMKGSIIAAQEGDVHAAARAREMGELLLRHHDIAVEPVNSGTV
jgi:AcrR family transcriptional regulator